MEGYITSVELNGPEETYNINSNGELVPEAPSSPVSVYFSSSPEPSMEPSQDLLDAALGSQEAPQEAPEEVPNGRSPSPVQEPL